MKLKDALGIRPGEVISLVGGGGKTSTMFALAKELASAGGCVITTTTTRILDPSPTQTPMVIVERDETELVRWLLESLPYYDRITLASEQLASGKLAGINPEFPSYGTDRERNFITRLFNHFIEICCQQNNIIFVSIFEELLNPDLSTNTFYFKDNSHLSTKALPLAKRKIEKA